MSYSVLVYSSRNSVSSYRFSILSSGFILAILVLLSMIVFGGHFDPIDRQAISVYCIVTTSRRKYFGFFFGGTIKGI